MRSHSSSRLRIHLPDHRAEIKLHLAHGVVLRGVGHGLGQRLVDAGEMPQQQALGALEFVDLDVIGERAELLEHLPRDGLGPDVFLTHPRVTLRERVERGVDELAVRLGVFQLFQFLHALVVLHAVLLHLGDGLRFELVELPAQDQVRVFEDGLHQRQHTSA